MSLKLLLHICCAPCSAYTVGAFGLEGFEVHGFFFNPNIHPYSEYLRRRDALYDYQPKLGVEIDFSSHYRPEEYFHAVVFEEGDRCRRCYELRLRATAREALARGREVFSTTLLYSIYQKHDLLRSVGERIGEEEGVPFFYRDLRDGWQRGYDRYKKSGLYRQDYCGCIFSEKERLERKQRKR